MIQSSKPKQLIDTIGSWLSNTKRNDPLSSVYANTLEKYDDLEIYQDIYDKNISRRKMETSVRMEYSSKIQFGESIRSVKNSMPNKKVQVLNSSNGIKRNVLLYRLIIGEQKVKIEFHFHKNKLFYYKFIFSYIEEEQKAELINALLEKYHLPTIEVTNYSIFDTDNNCILVTDHFDFTMSYTQMDSPFFDLIEEQQVVNPSFSAI